MGSRSPRHLILSPHLDDAALSCGGAIHRWAAAGEPVLVVSVMTADPPPGDPSPYAAYQHGRWDLPPREAYAARRAEDRAALERLGAGWAHLALVDCIYRRGPGGPYYSSDEELFGAVHPEDAGLVKILREQFAALARAGAGELAVYAPLGLGNHVDHQLVRQAAEGWRGDEIVYYEDYPYAETVDPDANPGQLAPWVIPLDEADLSARIEAVACYRSQMAVLFGDRDRMAARIRAHAGRLAPPGCAGGERFWRPVV
jgi:LmbE family N-acetylglucosaminyl deacetylase